MHEAGKSYHESQQSRWMKIVAWLGVCLVWLIAAAGFLLELDAGESPFAFTVVLASIAFVVWILLSRLSPRMTLSRRLFLIGALSQLPVIFFSLFISLNSHPEFAGAPVGAPVRAPAAPAPTTSAPATPAPTASPAPTPPAPAAQAPPPTPTLTPAPRPPPASSGPATVPLSAPVPSRPSIGFPQDRGLPNQLPRTQSPPTEPPPQGSRPSGSPNPQSLPSQQSGGPQPSPPSGAPRNPPAGVAIEPEATPQPGAPSTGPQPATRSAPARRPSNPPSPGSATEPVPQLYPAPPPSATPASPARVPYELPQFPWPPPHPSASYVLPQTMLAGGTTVGQVFGLIISALETEGYVERSFFRTQDNGVALVTRLERIEDDGSSFPGVQRWPPVLQTRSGLIQLLRGLFYVDSGHYRVIVFVVQGRPFSQSPETVSGEEALQWLQTGANTLPQDVAARPFGHDECTALIYEFASDGKNVQVVPSQLTGKQHLEKAGILTVLEKPN
jgi:hypothetical protein